MLSQDWQHLSGCSFKRRLISLLIAAVALAGIGQGSLATLSIALDHGSDILALAHAGPGEPKPAAISLIEQVAVVSGQRDPELDSGSTPRFPNNFFVTQDACPAVRAGAVRHAIHTLSHCFAISAARAPTGPPA